MDNFWNNILNKIKKFTLRTVPRGMFAQFVTMPEKQILARAIEIQKEN